MKKKPKEYRARDAVTGKFITLAEAAARKCSTVVEKRKKKPKR